MAFQIRHGTFWIVETRWNRFCLPGDDLDPDTVFASVPDILELNAEDGWFLELPTLGPGGAPVWIGPFLTRGEATEAGVELGAPIPLDTRENPLFRQLRTMFNRSQDLPVAGSNSDSDNKEPEQTR
ncbi:MAG: hypothetical protein HYZ13_03765 [Acidobacteria bacterium]|nr:hypothetical protein [Acidobacteriota bacterium]